MLNALFTAAKVTAESPTMGPEMQSIDNME
jgi:hypothetical protein